jgi:predicted enzyme related to lactoylglutathione lyase
MAEFTVPKHGEICWQELTTQNLEAAKTFYHKLLDWKFEQSKLSPVIEYQEIHLDGQAMGGMMQITKEWGENWEKIPAHWMTYIAVDKCDEAV